MTQQQSDEGEEKVTEFYVYQTIGLTPCQSVPMACLNASDCTPEQLAMFEEWIKQQQAEEVMEEETQREIMEELAYDEVRHEIEADIAEDLRQDAEIMREFKERCEDE